MAIYTLTDDPVVEAETLLESGFVVMAVFKNPHPENRITLYGKLVNQPRPRGATRRPARRVARRR